jgi:hypothetical protein
VRHLRFSVLVAVLLAAGCGSTHGTGENADLVDESPDSSAVDESLAPGGLDGGLDAGSLPSHDADTSSDAGTLADASVDAGTDASADAEVDADAGELMCTLESEEQIVWSTPSAPYLFPVTQGSLSGLDLDWRGRAFVRITGVTAGARYSIEVFGGHAIELAVFDHDRSFEQASCIEALAAGTGQIAVCEVVAAHDTIDVTLDALRDSQGFILTIVPALPAQGTEQAPLPITPLEDGSYEAVASTVARSYYEITGLSSGQAYEIIASGESAPISLRVFADAARLGPYDGGTRTEAHAFAAPTARSLFIDVESLSISTKVGISVRPAQGESEGTPQAPVELIGPGPLEGEIGWASSIVPGQDSEHERSDSFYVVTGLSPGAYVVTMIAYPGVELRVFGDDATFHGVATTTRAGVQSWAQGSGRISGDALYVQVRNEGGSGGPIELHVAPAQYLTEGTPDAPIELPLTDLPLSVSAEEHSSSHYAITGLSPGQDYVLRVHEFQPVAMRLAAYDDASLSRIMCTVHWRNTMFRQCNIRPTGDTIYIRANVDRSHPERAIGAAGSFHFIPIEVRSEGTLEHPLPISCTDGYVAGLLGTNGLSFYELKDLEPGKPYLVEVRNNGFITLDVFADESSLRLDGARCTANGEDAMSARCVQTPLDGSLFVRVSGYSGGIQLDLTITPLESSAQGQSAAPLALELGSGPASHLGSVSPERPSYYELTGLKEDIAYVVRLAPLHETIDALFFHRPGFDNNYDWKPVVPGAPLELAVLADSSSPEPNASYFSLQTLAGTGASTDVRIDVIESPLQSEGTRTPVPLTLAELPRTSAVDGTRSTMFELSGLTVGQAYVATLSDASRDTLLFNVYSSGVSLNPPCTGAASDEQLCTFTAESASITVVIGIYDAPHASFTFDLEVSQP